MRFVGLSHQALGIGVRRSSRHCRPSFVGKARSAECRTVNGSPHPGPVRSGHLDPQPAVLYRFNKAAAQRCPRFAVGPTVVVEKQTA